MHNLCPLQLALGTIWLSLDRASFVERPGLLCDLNLHLGLDRISTPLPMFASLPWKPFSCKNYNCVGVRSSAKHASAQHWAQ